MDINRIENLKSEWALKRHLIKAERNLTKLRKKIRWLSNQRNLEVLTLWNLDHSNTYQTLGDRYGITRERIRQLLNRAEAEGYYVRSTKERTVHNTKEKINAVFSEVVNAIAIFYGTPEWIEWKDNFFEKNPGWIYRKFVRFTLLNCWKKKLIDPLDNFRFDFKIKEQHMRVLNLRMNHLTIEECANILSCSVAQITKLLRDLKQIGLYRNPKLNQNQVASVSLDKEQINKKLDWIREGLTNGKTLRDLEKEIGNTKQSSQVLFHFITRHHYMPKIAVERYKNARA